MDHLRQVFYCLCVSLVAACGGGGGSNAPSLIVTVTPAMASVAVYQQVQLTATITGVMAGPVTWSSSNMAVAMVNSTGLVSALSVGQATITATSGGQSGMALITTTMGIAFASVSAGASHTCGVTATGVGYCWGDNSSGQLGNGTTTNSATPMLVSGGYNFAMISAGATHTCGITSFAPTSPAGGTLYCWGGNSSGQLGNGTTTGSTTPVPVAVSSMLGFISVTAGGSHTCGITLPMMMTGFGGVGYCWGENSSGQLGNGTLTNSSVPVAIATTPAGATSPVIVGWFNLSAGNNHTCGNDAQPEGLGSFPGTLGYCWGDNTYSELGIGTTTNSAVPALTYTLEQVSAGTGFTCGLSQCWGNNSSGQLGNGTTTNSSVPVSITAVPNAYNLLSAGSDHTCAVTSYGVPEAPQVGGIAYCWGGNAFGQLGNATTTNSTTPALVVGGLTFETISAGGSHTCGVAMTNPPGPSGSGAVYCWGDNASGQLGDGTTTSSATPVQLNVAGLH